jgi:hypothetical protein
MYGVCCSLRSKEEKYSTPVTKPIKTCAQNSSKLSPKSIKTLAAQNPSKLSTRYLLHTASRLGRRLLTGRETHQRKGGKKKGKSIVLWREGREIHPPRQNKKTSADSKSKRIQQNKTTKRLVPVYLQLGKEERRERTR